jgi:hypothetical protein
MGHAERRVHGDGIVLFRRTKKIISACFFSASSLETRGATDLAADAKEGAENTVVVLWPAEVLVKDRAQRGRAELDS